MILEARTTDFIEQLSSAAPTPGGGGASAAVGAFAAALGLMVANLTVGKKKYANVEEEIIRVRERLEKLRDQLIMQVDEDDQKVRIYHREGKKQSAVVMMADEDGEFAVIVFSGTFTLDDVLRMTK